MPVPTNIAQANVVVNSQRATSLGRAPKVVKAWRQAQPPQKVGETE